MFTIHRFPNVFATLAVGCFLLFMASAASAQSTITVKTTADTIDNDGQCSLREAINNANANSHVDNTDCAAGSGHDTIKFNLPGAGPHVIDLLTEFPEIKDPVTIDGTSQPGNEGVCTTSIPDRPTYVLTIRGGLITSNPVGTALKFKSGSEGSTLRGLNLQGFSFATLIVDTSNHLIECNFIGTTADGSAASSTNGEAVWIRGSSTDVLVQHNLLSGSSFGVRFHSTATNNTVINNFIGTNRAGTAAIPNNVGIADNSTGNKIGTSGNGNLISGNGTGITVGSNSTVYANLIGTNATGTAAIPNGTGITAGSNNTIGSEHEGDRNLISGNTGIGLVLSDSLNTVLGNYIGTDITGTFAVPNGSHGISITGPDNRIGFGGAGNGNLISGNTGDGIHISGAHAHRTRMWSNSIGTNAAVTAALPNGGNGVSVVNNARFSPEGITIGTRLDHTPNVIAGNTGHGVYISDGDGSNPTQISVLGNYIGTDLTGTLDLGNGLDGIHIGRNIQSSLIGQWWSDTRFGNVIAFNEGNGISIAGGNSNYGISIQHTNFYQNDGLGIDLDNDGVSPNDNGDGDGGPNRKQNFPDLIAAGIECSGDLTVEYSLSSSAATRENYHDIIFYLADVDGTEGALFLTRTQYDRYPNAVTATLGAASDLGVVLGDRLIALTDYQDNTSEFSTSITVDNNCLIEVTNTNDSGTGSLRQAILDANTGLPGLNIAFDIPGTGPHTISPLTALPALTVPVTIDGATQSGNESVCTTAIAARPAYQVILDGEAGGYPDLLTLGTGSGGSTIRGLNIRNASAALKITSDGNTVECNFLGTNETGTIKQGNSFNVVISAANNVIGGTEASAGNLISGGLSTGIHVTHSGATGNVIQGNIIGADKTGTQNLGNSTGVSFLQGASSNTMGGVSAGEANTIAFNGTGIDSRDGNSSGNTFRGNSFYQNTNLAVDLGNPGATANDAGDGDTGPNKLQNFPELRSALLTGGDVVLTYAVDSDPANQAYPITVDFYTPDTDNDEGQTLLFSDTFSASDYPGSTAVSASATALGLSVGDTLIAIATDADGNTSEFSSSVTLMSSDCFTVTTTADTGTGSLRAALTCANATPELDTITFTIPGMGPHVIAPATNLPPITAPVIIDGATQPGNETVCSTAIPSRPTYQVIVENGLNLGTGFNLGTGSNGSTIRGLNIRGFGTELIDVNGSTSHTIACNFLGTNETGTAGVGSSGAGVWVEGGSAVTIGGTDATQGNLISTGSTTLGVVYLGDGSGNTLQHNFIGTNKAGTGALRNDIGLVVSSSTGTSANLAILDNLISGNNTIGVAVDDVDGLEFKRNLIGTDVTGTANLGNGWQGLAIGRARTASDLVIGGTAKDDGNTIAFNGRDGVTVENNSRVALLGNNIFSNTNLGIDLADGGAGGTNDAGDGDTGDNNLQNFPDLVTGPTMNGPDLIISYSVDSTPTNAAYPIRVEFFLADADDQEGQAYLGADTYTESDYNGCMSAPCTKGATIAGAGAHGLGIGDNVLATATDANGNTSEFSGVVTTSADCFTVTTTADSGAGSLREAMTCANNTAGLNSIKFLIEGDGPHVITLSSNLPAISDPVIIDGASQPGNEAVCTAAIPDRPAYDIVIDGNGVAILGFRLNAGSDGSTIRGLNIRGMQVYGILAVGPSDGGHTITCNFIGTDETGMTTDANSIGALLTIKDITIGGTNPGDANLISGNTEQGLLYQSSNATGEIIQGNFIGTDKTGTGDLGNGSAGIEFTLSARTATIGGTATGAGNIIAYNAVGILDKTSETGHEIRRNAIFANTGPGIDLGNDGATANDTGDADNGANNLQNTPVLTEAAFTSTALTVTYSVDTATGNATYPLDIDFFLADSDGQEGQTYLGSTTYASADAQTSVSATITPAAALTVGDLLLATATDAEGNTSEFSQALTAVATPEVDLAVSVSESADPVMAGSGAGNLAYTVVVTNNGPSQATGVTLENRLTLPSGVTVDSVTPSTGTFSDSTWTLGTLASGGRDTLLVMLTVDASAAVGIKVISNTARITAVDQVDTDSINDFASEATSIQRTVDLAVTVSESADPVIAGSGAGNLTYTVTVTNNGPSEASGVELGNTLTLPSGATVDSVTPSQGTFSDPTWTLGSLASGASDTLTITLTVNASTPAGTDVIADSAWVATVNEPDTDSANDSASAATGVSAGSGTMRYVATTGTDTDNTCLLQTSPCATLTHALEQASAGDTISLDAGSYAEARLLIDKALTLQGVGVIIE